ncbi:MAG: D-alanyl-D-alanine carboxypeptidase [Oceanospirillaceae bacterium]|nr:D-alanyl-D-alanine carboxypeptidase [Oceanospirillaceae bacterium]
MNGLFKNHFMSKYLISSMFLMLLVMSHVTAASEMSKHSAIIQGIPKAALLLADTSARHSISIRPEQLLVPASTLKIVTAYLAIKRWGLEHKFYTDFYYDQGVLWIKGFGDPYITSEEILLMSKAIKELKLKKIKKIYVDNRYFPQLRLDGRGVSDNPYDAGNAALVVNFNTLFVQINDGVVSSAESQTPITPLAKKLAANIDVAKKRISLPGGRDMAAIYFAQVFAKIHSKRNLPTKVASLPKSAKFIYRHYSSKTMEELLSAMLKYSNNFIANQLFLMLPKTSESQAVLSVSAAQQYYTQSLEKEFSFKGASFVDGAGLSRLNKISAEQLLQVLEVFRPWIDLLPERKKGLKVKTGTLSDNHSLAGYKLDREQHWQAFVLLINKRMAASYRFQVARALLTEK